MNLRAALDWLRAKGAEFLAADTRILEGRARAGAIARGLPRGSAERAAAGRIVERWSALLALWTAANIRWQALARRLPGLDEGLGIFPVIPLAIAGSVVAVAISMGLVLRKLSAEERAVRLLERGRITPAEAIELAASIEGGRPGLFGALPGGVMPLALAAGAALFFLRRK